MVTTDVFVIGGGPAGLAVAIAARGKGLRVMVADAARPPIDKACGEGLMPDALAALARLGITLDSVPAFPFRGIQFLGAGCSVEASFPHGAALGIRRTTLHGILAGRARAMGIQMLWGTRVTAISDSGADLDGQCVGAKFIVGADGQNSRVRRWSGLDKFDQDSRRFGFRRHYAIAPWTDCMEIYWGAGCQIYTTPVSAGEVCVALISRDPRLRLDQALMGFPDLTARLKGVASTTLEMGAVSATRRLRRVVKGNVALIGDASGSVDAITGEGMCIAFQQALDLAEALVANRLNGYAPGHSKVMRRPVAMGRMMLLLDSFPTLRHRVLRSMAERPGIFAHMLAMHVGDLRPAAFATGALLPLGWGMLTG